MLTGGPLLHHEPVALSEPMPADPMAAAADPMLAETDAASTPPEDEPQPRPSEDIKS
jgi:hypothetical protein